MAKASLEKKVKKALAGAALLVGTAFASGCSTPPGGYSGSATIYYGTQRPVIVRPYPYPCPPGYIIINGRPCPDPRYMGPYGMYYYPQCR